MRAVVIGLATAAVSTLMFAAPQPGKASAASAGVPHLGQDSSLIERVRMGGGGHGGGMGGGFGGGFRGGGFGGGGMGFRGGGFGGGGMGFQGGGFGRGMAFRGGDFGGARFSGMGQPRGAGFRRDAFGGPRHFGRDVRFADRGFRDHRVRRVFRNGRFVFVTVPAVYGAYYDDDYYGYGCGWLRARAVYTGSGYWWSRYYDCVGWY